MIDLSPYHAVIFDSDGTLVESFKTTPLTGRAERIAALQQDDKHVAICTNQAGPLWREATGHVKYPDAAILVGNIKSIIDSLGLQGVHWYVSIGDERAIELLNGEENYQAAIERIKSRIEEELDPEIIHVSGLTIWRKPEPGMLLAAAQQLNLTVAQCLYVGDRDEDRQSAMAAQMEFKWSSIFFDDQPF
jgi:beta-phosphoglucomutase-like phosphatase (HAD superfamily)